MSQSPSEQAATHDVRMVKPLEPALAFERAFHLRPSVLFLHQGVLESLASIPAIASPIVHTNASACSIWRSRGRGLFMPLVSIITPVFNAARWLPETFATVRAQTLTDWEQILVDDGSTDDSLAMAEAVAAEDPRFRVLRTSSNGGPSLARNLALEAARGRFIAFLDADDLWYPEKLARSVEWMTTHGYGFIYHDYRHMTSDGTSVGALITGPEELDFRTLHTRRGHGGCMSMVIDRERVHGFHFPRCFQLTHEDFIAWLSIIQQGERGHRLPVDLGRYRLSAESRSSNKRKAILDTWIIYRKYSKLPLIRAVHWWAEYIWNSYWLYRHARPSKTLGSLNAFAIGNLESKTVSGFLTSSPARSWLNWLKLGSK